MDVTKHFLGLWNLIKWIAKQADGRGGYPYGEDAVGQLWYDAKVIFFFPQLGKPGPDQVL
jgi:hypothetical protein